MKDQSDKKRLIAVLWFVAGGLAVVAVCIRYFSDRELSWSVLLGGLFCLTMGVATLRRNAPQSPEGK